MRLPANILKIALVFLFVQAKAQVYVSFLLDSNTSKLNNVFLAGNINNWQPADTGYLFKNGRLNVLVSKSKTVEYKLTKGSWAAVETEADGRDRSNRVFTAVNDTVINTEVKAFRVADKGYEKKHTASKNVVVMDTAFYIPQLKRFRTIRLYLPPNYATSNKKYKVLYMADGQNCFDEFTSFSGEWHIDEALDHLYDSCGKSLIVVAVDHGNELRLQEYSPYAFSMVSNAEGKAYAAFLAETLKPFIDTHYRTKPAGKSTFIAGSSMGGLISTYTIARYPEKFGNAGIFSPSFWVAPGMLQNDLQNQLPFLKNEKIFFYAGSSEDDSLIAQVTTIKNMLDKGGAETVFKVDAAGLHNEAFWSKWFALYLNYIFSNN
jgi:alpha-glucosidase